MPCWASRYEPAPTDLVKSEHGDHIGAGPERRARPATSNPHLLGRGGTGGTVGLCELVRKRRSVGAWTNCGTWVRAEERRADQDPEVPAGPVPALLVFVP